MPYHAIHVPRDVHASAERQRLRLALVKAERILYEAQHAVGNAISWSAACRHAAQARGGSPDRLVRAEVAREAQEATQGVLDAQAAVAVAKLAYEAARAAFNGSREEIPSVSASATVLADAQEARTRAQDQEAAALSEVKTDETALIEAEGTYQAIVQARLEGKKPSPKEEGGALKALGDARLILETARTLATRATTVRVAADGALQIAEMAAGFAEARRRWDELAKLQAVQVGRWQKSLREMCASQARMKELFLEQRPLLRPLGLRDVQLADTYAVLRAAFYAWMARTGNHNALVVAGPGDLNPAWQKAVQPAADGQGPSLEEKMVHALPLCRVLGGEAESNGSGPVDAGEGPLFEESMGAAHE
jgi:hypothetical protein